MNFYKIYIIFSWNKKKMIYKSLYTNILSFTARIHNYIYWKHYAGKMVYKIFLIKIYESVYCTGKILNFYTIRTSYIVSTCTYITYVSIMYNIILNEHVKYTIYIYIHK